MQLRLMLRGEGFRGKRVGNQTAAESHSNGCTAFLNFLPTSSLSIKQIVFLTLSLRKESQYYQDFQRIRVAGFF